MTTSASRAPARRPAKKEVAAPNIGEPSGERIALDAASKPEKRIAALGVAKYTIESRPWCRVRVRVGLEDRPTAWERAVLSVRVYQGLVCGGATL